MVKRCALDRVEMPKPHISMWLSPNREIQCEVPFPWRRIGALPRHFINGPTNCFLSGFNQSSRFAILVDFFFASRSVGAELYKNEK